MTRTLTGPRGVRICLAAVIGVVTTATAGYSGYPGEPDCLSGGVPPHYSALNAPPTARADRVPTGAAPPPGASCFGKSDSGATWITVASIVQTSDSRSTFIERFGSISSLLGVRYWSTTDQKWRPLVSSAFAIASKNSKQPRADYSLAELATGEDRFYSLTDSRLGHAVTYRLRLWRSQSAGLVVDIDNVDAIRQWGITLYAPGGLHTLYFLEERSPSIWTYYSITRALPQSFLAEGHDKSYINRAVALYRYITRQHTDAEPPSAP